MIGVINFTDGDDVQREQKEDDVVVYVSENLGDVAVAVDVFQVMPSAQGCPLRRVRRELDRLLRPVRGDLERLAGQNEVGRSLRRSIEVGLDVYEELDATKIGLRGLRLIVTEWTCQRHRPT